MGDESAGKTSLIQKYIESEKEMSKEYEPTEEATFYSNKHKISEYGKGSKSVNLQIWDTPGQE